MYKLKSEDNPVVLVKAYGVLEGIPPEVVAYHIKDIPTRLSWLVWCLVLLSFLLHVITYFSVR